MKILNAGLTEYNVALKNLNDKLVAIGKYIEVRAIGGLVPRVTDQLDFLDLLGSLDIHSIDELSKSSVTKDMKDKYPRSYVFLLKQGNW